MDLPQRLRKFCRFKTICSQIRNRMHFIACTCKGFLPDMLLHWSNDAWWWWWWRQSINNGLISIIHYIYGLISSTSFTPHASLEQNAVTSTPTHKLPNSLWSLPCPAALATLDWGVTGIRACRMAFSQPWATSGPTPEAASVGLW
jgi:hypothetical protein